MGFLHGRIQSGWCQKGRGAEPGAPGAAVRAATVARSLGGVIEQTLLNLREGHPLRPGE